MKTIPVLMMLILSQLAYAADVKDADLAGSWYPSNKQELSFMIRGYLDEARPGKIDGRIFALIAPHAGYAFSGPVAAYGFKLVEKSQFNTVVLIGISHRKPFDGIAIYDRGSFRTPLGEIPVDAKLASEIAGADPRIGHVPELFAEENSLEIQIPFIQTALPGSAIVPIAFGTQKYEDAVMLADALARALKDRDDVLVVASTDLSHYHRYDEANSIDAFMMKVLNTMKAKDLYDEARLGTAELCGIMPVAATLLASEKLGFGSIKVLKYANSGDTSGDKSRVVGYLSAVIYRKGGADAAGNVSADANPQGRSAADALLKDVSGGGDMLNEAQRKRLLQIARESITSFVRDGKRKDFSEKDPLLNAEMGAFVTLHENGDLRGCIGNMAAAGPLYRTVASMAIEAATEDPRFPTLSAGEIDKVDLEISVLSPMKRVSGPDEIRIPGHGVVVRSGFRGGVYLPQVATETGWGKEEFLTSLCAHKAGLPPDAWKDPATELYVFTAEVFGEKPVAKAEREGKR
jgi:AmmeMemoRadiSam system protein B/AmmeMemoRadiSam system protein A